MTTPERAMVIAAHPDDTEYTTGALVSTWKREGVEVAYVIVTNGNKGTEDPDLTSDELARIRACEQRRAATRLGVDQVRFLGYEDGMLEPSVGLRRDLTREIRAWRPNIVVTFDPETRFMTETYPNHPDHRATGDATVDAVFPSARDRLSFPELLEEGLEPHKVSEIWLFATHKADHWVDVEPFWEQKLAALKDHASQIDPANAEDDLREWSARWAEGGPYQLAEAFRRIKLD
jgi:LmbE family N-acetylglucosaminyl deacetylase